MSVGLITLGKYHSIYFKFFWKINQIIDLKKKKKDNLFGIWVNELIQYSKFSVKQMNVKVNIPI